MTGKRSILERMRDCEPIVQPEDSEFFDLLIPAKLKMAAYNRISIEDGFETILTKFREMVGKVGQGSFAVPPVTIDIGLNITIGENCFFNTNTTFLDTYPITFGDDVMVGPNCCFYPVGHPLDIDKRILRDPVTGKKTHHLATGAPIVIEDGVWLGGSVIVVQGVTIGARSVVGAGSVVTKSIPPDVFAAGNPCRVIRAINVG